MDAVSLLREARAHVERGWCQGTAWRDDERLSIVDSSLKAPDATAFCLGGAVTAALGDGPHAVAMEAGALLRRALGLGHDGATVYGGLVDWNDAAGRTQQQVLEAFDRAISLGLREAGDR